MTCVSLPDDVFVVALSGQRLAKWRGAVTWRGCAVLNHGGRRLGLRGGGSEREASKRNNSSRGGEEDNRPECVHGSARDDDVPSVCRGRL